jgi:nucleoside-diphosphate-sugar epimerase
MNVTIIGCGYVGKAVAQLWKAAGHCVSVTTRNSERVTELKAIADHVILLQSDDLPEILSKKLVDQHVVLLCVAADNASQYESTYLHTAQALVKAAVDVSALKQIIYTSSTSVYGEHHGEWVDENTQLFPSNANTKILIETEQTLQFCQTEERRMCIFRLGEIVGPDREISDRLRRMSGHPLPGTGENYTNLSQLDDITGAIDFAVNQQLNGVYNLCGNLHISRKELYHLLCEKHGLPHVTWNASAASVHGGNKRVSSEKLKNAGFAFADYTHVLSI